MKTTMNKENTLKLKNKLLRSILLQEQKIKEFNKSYGDYSIIERAEAKIEAYKYVLRTIEKLEND